tara:strand:- start:23072 stop:23359 length:288 start_codon:yes stop_codon:yes gene_type:complete
LGRRDEKPVLSGVEGSLGVYPERSRRACTDKKLLGDKRLFLCKIFILIQEVRNENPVLSGVEENLGVYPERSRRACTDEKLLGNKELFLCKIFFI